MGLFVAIEGIDGSGKGTQAKRLLDRLEHEGRRATLLSFPRYESTFFGRAIGTYLNGGFGSLEHVDPHLAAVLFAGDRHESRNMLLEAIRDHDVVIADRFVASNVAHQGARRSGAARVELVDWILELEHEVFALPRPDLVVLLDVPVAVAAKQIATKRQRSYTDAAADLHESDHGHLDRARAAYLELADREPNWHRVPGALDAETARPIEEVAEDVYELVAGRLDS